MQEDDEERRAQLQEEGPAYRSVAVLRPYSVSSGPFQQQSGSVFSPKISKFGKQAKEENAAFLKQPNYPSSSSSASSPSTSRWNVRGEQLSKLPLDYKLVRTNVFVEDEDPQFVADRICDTLRTLSIAILDSSEQPQEEENTRVAEAQNGVKFAIHLFKNRNNNDNAIVVEIRRRAGCSFAFRDAAKVILRSAKKNQQQQRTTTSPASKERSRRFLPIPAFLPKRSREECQTCALNGFRVAHKMLLSTKYESQLLGLENMEKMLLMKASTDDEGFQAKEIVAKSILGNRDDCLRRLLSLLLDDEGFFVVSSEEEKESSCSFSHSASLLRRKVLAVLANSCEAMRIGSGCNDEPASEGVPDFVISSSLRTLLLRTMREARIRPHDALQAARCARYLLVPRLGGEGGIEKEESLNAMLETVSVCRDAARDRHAALENETDQLFAQLVLQKKKRENKIDNLTENC